MSSLLHESIMHAVIEQTRLCLLNWLAVPKADNLCWGLLLNFPDSTPNSHKMPVNCWFKLCTFWHLSAGFHRFSKHLFQYNLPFWQQPIPVNPWFSFLRCLTILNNAHVKKHNQIKEGKYCPALLDTGPHFLQEKKNCLHCYKPTELFFPVTHFLEERSSSLASGLLAMWADGHGVWQPRNDGSNFEICCSVSTLVVPNWPQWNFIAVKMV